MKSFEECMNILCCCIKVDDSRLDASASYLAAENPIGSTSYGYTSINSSSPISFFLLSFLFLPSYFPNKSALNPELFALHSHYLFKTYT